jgi:endonuclease I
MIKISQLLLLALLGLLNPVLNAQPSGYYNSANGLHGDELKAALHNIIRGHNRITYESVWTHFATTDTKPNGKVWDMYSDIPEETPPYEYVFFDNQCSSSGLPEGSCYNREHSFPVSWWGGGSLASDTIFYDLFHLIPADSWVNSHRSNHPYGIVDGPATTLNGSRRGANSFEHPDVFTGTVFEPIDAYKGDLARHYFYISTRYMHKILLWSENTPMLEGDDFAPWASDMLLQWHEQDPVSQKEIDRNNAVYDIQNNRNPFIDYPEYVYLIWGNGFAMEPENHVHDFSANTITLEWTDADGEVLPDGYLVRMSNNGFNSIETPEDGVQVDDGSWDKNVLYGMQKVTFGGLTPGSTYFFKIFGYTVSGGVIDYKTDGVIQQVSKVAR